MDPNHFTIVLMAHDDANWFNVYEYDYEDRPSADTNFKHLSDVMNSMELGIAKNIRIQMLHDGKIVSEFTRANQNI